MLNNPRFLPFCLFATTITFLCFYVMTIMTQTPQVTNSQSIQDITFSVHKSFTEPEEDKKTTPPEKIVKQTIKQPPVAPKLEITTDQSRPNIEIPNGQAKLTLESFNQFNGPRLFKQGSFDNNPKLDQGLIPMVMIQPRYPHKALINKIEGWVKVRFTINEFGKVTKAKVLAAEPSNIFNTTTLKTVYKSQYEPMIIDGKAQATVAEQVVYFKLPNNKKTKQ